MASHSSPPRKKLCAHSPNWLTLPVDVWTSIIGRLGVVDILTSAQYVCSTWRRICRDPSVWTFINIILTFGHRDSELYRRAVDLSCGGLLGVGMKGYYRDGILLRYITDRSKQLKYLRLVYCHVSDEELIEVGGKIPALEWLDLSYCYHISSQAVAAVGKLCPLLESFKLNARGSTCSSTVSDDEAFAIAKNMSGLHHLQIFGNKLTNVGLIAILDGCQQLEYLDLRHCFHVNLDADLERRCREQIKQFRGPNDSTDDYPFKSELVCRLSYDDESLSRSDFDFMSDCDSG